MKLRNLLKHFEHLDLDTEIYFSSQTFRVLTNKNILIGSVVEILHLVLGKNLFIPDEKLKTDKTIVEVEIVL